MLLSTCPVTVRFMRILHLIFSYTILNIWHPFYEDVLFEKWRVRRWQDFKLDKQPWNFLTDIVFTSLLPSTDQSDQGTELSANPEIYIYFYWINSYLLHPIISIQNIKQSGVRCPVLYGIDIPFFDVIELPCLIWIFYFIKMILTAAL